MTEEAQAPEITMITMRNGLPLFIGDVNKDTLIAHANEQGYVRFYVLAGCEEEEVTETVGQTIHQSKTPSTPKVFLVTTNLIGHVIQAANTESKDIGLHQYPIRAWFTLPKIPWEMVEKMDQFFRAVYEKIGTEAILLLTYDPRKDTPEGKHTREGWGILVPKQTNSAAHCHYDPQSVIDDKDDEVIIVGTAHSHPAMSAFASHTDHNDQVGNDGIHITFGWTKGSSHTEVHIELQMAGEAYLFRPEHAFEQAPKLPPQPEIQTWTERVAKEGFGQKQKDFRATSSHVGSTAWTTRGGAHQDEAEKRDPNKHYTQDGVPFTLPEGAPSPKDGTIIVRLLSEDETKCPMCADLFRSYAVQRRRCWSCYSFLLLPEEGVEDIVKIREGRADCPTWELIPEAATRDIMIWNRYLDQSNVIQSTISQHGEALGKAPAQ